MTTRTTTTKLKFRSGDNQLTGILVEPAPPRGPSEASQRRRQVVILLHGLYQHKNINMLKPFGQRIAADEALDVATFRFDCRGLGESEGVSSYTPHFINLSDLEAAVAFLEEERGLAVACIFGYSAGGNVATLFAAKHPGKVKMVTVHSARFRMDGVRDTITPEERAALVRDGSFEYKFTRRGKPTTLVVDDAVLDLFTSIDMGAQCRAVPASTRVLCTHGLADDRVPARDSAGYVSNLANVTQHLFPTAGHDYKEEGVFDELYEVFKTWFLGGAEEASERRRVAFSRL